MYKIQFLRKFLRPECVRCLGSSFQKRRQTNFASHSIKQILLSVDNLRDKTVSICGWVKNIRKLKNAVFVDLEDGSCSKRFQVILQPESAKAAPLSAGCSLQVKGKLNQNPQDANNVELIGDSFTVLGTCPIEKYPFRPKKHYTNDYIRDFLHLRPRTRSFASLLRLRSACYTAIHDFFQREGFFHVHTPIITANDCEGAGEVFNVTPAVKTKGVESFFDTPVYLTVSAQLHLESVIYGLSKVYTCNPTFRAENSKSRKHLSEFYMIEAEQAFINSVTDIMDLVEQLIKNVTHKVLSSQPDDVQTIMKGNDSESEAIQTSIVSSPFPRISYTDAIKILQGKQLNSSKINWGQDLNSEHEQILVKHFDNIPVFVTHFPSDIKPFYMKRDPDGGEFAECFDLLAPISGEICGGSLREDSEDILNERLNILGLTDALSWYRELRRFGSVPHGGFGMGFERYLQSILGITNIKDAIPFPRWPHHCHM